MNNLAEESRLSGPGCLAVRQGNFCARIVLPGESMRLESCLRLRHRYFVEERRWVLANPNFPGVETDRYDVAAYHLAVFNADSEIPAAYLRVLPRKPEVGFMLEREFACLLPGRADEPPGDSVELSRLVVVAPPGEGKLVVELLLKLLYRLSLEELWQRFYIVVEENWLAAFTRRFHLPFTPLAEPLVFPDGVRVIAAVATLEELEVGVLRGSPEKYGWYVEHGAIE